MRSRIPGFLAGGAVLLAAACGSDQSAEPTAPAPEAAVSMPGCAGSQKPAGSSEGEVYGIIFQNGQRTCQLWGVSMDPDPVTQTRLHMPSYRAELITDWKWANMFEWWDPLAGYPCSAASLAAYVQNGSSFAEVPHAASNPKEGHCVRPGRYTFYGPNREGIPVDYIQWSQQTVVNSGTGANEYVETAGGYDPSLLSSWQDLVIHVDLTTVHPGDNPVLEIQNAGSNPYASPFTNAASPSGTAADWFRFSVMRSTSNWQIDTRGPALARLYYDGTDLSQASGYYSYIPEGLPVLRVRRFPNPTTATRVYTVGLELLRPDEDVTETPTVTRTVTITRINPDLSPGNVSAPGTAFTGQSMNVSVQERNLGSNQFAPVEAGWTGKLYLSTDQVLSPATDALLDTYIETQAIPALQTILANRQVLVPPHQPAGTYYLIASLDANGNVLESNEGNNVAASGPIVISEPLVACASFEGKTTWKWTDQIFSASCSSQGANIQYRWRTDAGGPWTAYSSSLTYDFAGHGTVGAHYVTLEVKNTSTGATATDTDSLTVQNGQVTMNGPTYITVKANYAYSANVASFWWERFVPSQTWTGGIGPQTNWTRTWSAGCYEVDLRADASGGGVLKRGRMFVTVAIGSGCGGPAE